jgi:hypothetical protein
VNLQTLMQGSLVELIEFSCLHKTL